MEDLDYWDARNAAIVARRKEGVTLKRIAREHGLCVERVRQILKREKGRPERERAEKERLAKAERDRQEEYAAMRAIMDGDLDNVPLSQMELDYRPDRILEAAGYSSAGDVARATDAELLCLRGFGRTSLHQVRRAVSDIALLRRGLT